MVRVPEVLASKAVAEDVYEEKSMSTRGTHIRGVIEPSVQNYVESFVGFVHSGME